MAYFEFDGTAPQNQTMKQLKTQLVVSHELATRLSNQLGNMTDAQAVSQFGKPDSGTLTLTQLQSTIDSIVTALEAVGVTNYTEQVGFTV